MPIQRILLAALLLFIGSTVFASTGGVSRRAVLTSSGCGPSGCHGGSLSASTSVKLVGHDEGSDVVVQAGQRIELAVVVANTLAAASGVNIAVKSALNGNTNVGVLETITGAGLTKLNSELTHREPKLMSNGVAEFRFAWVAPADADTVYLHAVGNAVNRNGRPDNGDQWNWMQPIRIIVTPTSHVAETPLLAVAALDLRPIPAHDAVFITIPDEARGEEFTMSVIASDGEVVHSRRNVTADAVTVAWDGRTATGSHAPNGVYVVMLQNDRRMLRGRAIILR